MRYTYYKTEDFAADPFFVKWVKDPDEKTIAFWENFLVHHPDKREYVEEAIEIVGFLDFSPRKPSLEETQQLKEEIRQRIVGVFPHEVSNSNVRFLTVAAKIKNTLSQANPYYQVAAVFIGLVFFTALYFFALPLTSNTYSYQTGFGEKKTVTLPDGSTVVLNANSVIQFSKDWEDDKLREVWLKGEAFFKVVKKKANDKKTGIKFIVHSEQLDIEVLGTRFNVNNRRGETKVVLNSGKIKLRLSVDKKEKVIYMKPGELVRFSKKESSMVKKKVQPELFSSWQNNELSFQNQSLEEIARVIQDQFGLEVILEDKDLAAQRFTGTTPSDDLDILFTSLENSFNAEIIKQNNKVIIKTNKKTN